MAEYISSDVLKHPNVAHGFFTRVGGVSDGLYKSLNVGYGSGDDKAKVHENRKRVLAALGSKQQDIMTCYQIHSEVVHVITAPDKDITREGDALVTNVPGLAIGILTADCVPVLFADGEARVVGAAHAGWKGAHAGIVERTIEAMERLGAKRGRIAAAIGPAIGQVSYEVGSELKNAFTSKNAAFSAYFKTGKDEAHHWFDVPGLVAHILRDQGIAKAEKLDYDTYALPERFFSFRRATHLGEKAYGRQISAIMLKESL